MLYCIAELCNYRQLRRLRADALAETEPGLLAMLGAGKARALGEGQGVWFAEVGEEGALDIDAAVSQAFRLHDFLSSRRGELFGFSIILASMNAPGRAGLEGGIRSLLSAVERDEQLWLSPESETLFAGYLLLEKREERNLRSTAAALYRVMARTRAPEPVAGAADHGRYWDREVLIGKALDIIAPRLNSGESREILYVHGLTGVGKTAILLEVARLLSTPAVAQPEGSGGPAGTRDTHWFQSRGDAPRIRFMRMHTLFKRRSPIHPFLNSIVRPFLSDVPRFLRGPERAAWSDAGGLLSWLSGTPGQDLLFPDRLLEDFAIGYGLYLRAYIRMASENGLPALLLCEDVESYHPAARVTLKRLCHDLLACPEFIPILSSTEKTVPEELAGLDVRPLYIHPLGKREIRSYSHHLFPGLEIPESLSRRLRQRSGGLHASVAAYLQYLLKTGRIRASGDHYEWVQNVGEEAPLPANPLSVSWFLIRSLHDDTFLLLYALYLAGGLLDKEELLRFLAEAGFDRTSAEGSLSALLTGGLMVEEDSLIPKFPALRKKLEELLGAEGASLKNLFLQHLHALWRAGKVRHHVLLFTFFARNGRTDLALRILPSLIRRELDEGDVAGARAFCDPRVLDFAVPPTAPEKAELAAVTAMGRLRCALLARKMDEAHEAYGEVHRVHQESGGRRTGLDQSARGEAAIECAKYHLATGSSSSALGELKGSLLMFEESKEQRLVKVPGRGERVAYLWLGATMLSDGRIGEAREYLDLSEKLCSDAGDRLGALNSATFLAVVLFLDGRLTQCLAKLEQGVERSRSICRRETELFLLFLKARTHFVLGLYEESALDLQGCLCLAALYSFDRALPTLRAWLGRAFVHKGDSESGLWLLRSLEQAPEALLFLSEGSLFSGDYENASRSIDAALMCADTGGVPAPEGIEWRHGFASVEGRCFRLGKGDACIRRTLSVLRAYLLGLRGFLDQGIPELHRLTRGDLAVEDDPNAYWYNHLYSRVLPETGSQNVDDKVTVLSKSLRGLQDRTSRIEAPAERSSFLSRNRWNRMIMEDARERKLV